VLTHGECLRSTPKLSLVAGNRNGEICPEAGIPGARLPNDGPRRLRPRSSRDRFYQPNQYSLVTLP